MSDEDFTFDMPTLHSARAMRHLISTLVTAFEKLDEVAAVKPNQMLEAYRTIKIGQTVDKLVAGNEKDFVFKEVFNQTLREVLEEYPIGKEL